MIPTDMTMPRITGLDLSGRALRIRPDIPVIICTGHSPALDPQSAEAAGISALIMKPVQTRELAQTIRRVIDTAKQGGRGCRS